VRKGWCLSEHGNGEERDNRVCKDEFHSVMSEMRPDPYLDSIICRCREKAMLPGS
jgi:hypothetical protein